MTGLIIQFIYLWTTYPLDEWVPAEQAFQGIDDKAPQRLVQPEEPDFPVGPQMPEPPGDPQYTPPPELGITGFYRDNPREIWKHTSVDRNGQFRPTILYTPEGLYRSSDGKPFPYPQASQLHWNLASPIK